jgi:DNA-binding response OmpR family regulator
VLADGIRSACEYEYGVNEGLRILVVDDDPEIRLLLTELLSRAGYRVDEAVDGRSALRQLFETPPALVILDVTMPEMDGYQTLERIRDLSDVPVIMLTARTQELERVRGLASGADDYVPKPFGRQELLARVQALLRRTGGKAEMNESYRDDFVEIDYPQRRVLVHDREVQLTPLEFKLLSAFVQHPNQVLSRDQLLELVWGDPYGVSGDQVKLYVGYLRKKLVPDSPDTAPVETVRGFGYRYKKSH